MVTHSPLTTCRKDPILRNVTLRGGLHAGKFKVVGKVKTAHRCAKHCCKSNSCDLAYFVFGECYLVQCFDDYLCQTTKATLPGFSPSVIRVKHVKAPRTPLHRPLINTVFSSIEPAMPVHPPKPNKTCAHSNVYNEVTLRMGYKSGVFSSHGKLNSSEDCLKICCKERHCDLVFMFLSNCFTVKCKSSFACEIVPARTSQYQPKIAYILHGTAKAPKSPFNFTVSKDKDHKPVNIVHFIEQPLTIQMKGEKKSHHHLKKKKKKKIKKTRRKLKGHKSSTRLSHLLDKLSGSGSMIKNTTHHKKLKHKSKPTSRASKYVKNKQKIKIKKKAKRKKFIKKHHRKTPMQKVLQGLSEVMQENHKLEKEVSTLLHEKKKRPSNSNTTATSNHKMSNQSTAVNSPLLSNVMPNSTIKNTTAIANQSNSVLPRQQVNPTALSSLNTTQSSNRLYASIKEPVKPVSPTVSPISSQQTVLNGSPSTTQARNISVAPTKEPVKPVSPTVLHISSQQTVLDGSSNSEQSRNRSVAPMKEPVKPVSSTVSPIGSQQTVLNGSSNTEQAKNKKEPVKPVSSINQQTVLHGSTNASPHNQTFGNITSSDIQQQEVTEILPGLDEDSFGPSQRFAEQNLIHHNEKETVKSKSRLDIYLSEKKTSSSKATTPKGLFGKQSYLEKANRRPGYHHDRDHQRYYIPEMGENPEENDIEDSLEDPINDEGDYNSIASKQPHMDEGSDDVSERNIYRPDEDRTESLEHRIVYPEDKPRKHSGTHRHKHRHHERVTHPTSSYYYGDGDDDDKRHKHRHHQQVSPPKSLYDYGNDDDGEKRHKHRHHQRGSHPTSSYSDDDDDNDDKRHKQRHHQRVTHPASSHDYDDDDKHHKHRSHQRVTHPTSLHDYDDDDDDDDKRHKHRLHQRVTHPTSSHDHDHDDKRHKHRLHQRVSPPTSSYDYGDGGDGSSIPSRHHKGSKYHYYNTKEGSTPAAVRGEHHQNHHQKHHQLKYPSSGDDVDEFDTDPTARHRNRKGKTGGSTSRKVHRKQQSHHLISNIGDSSGDEDATKYHAPLNRHQGGQQRKDFHKLKPTTSPEFDDSEDTPPTMSPTTHYVMQHKIFTPPGHKTIKKIRIDELYEKVNELYGKMDSLILLESNKINNASRSKNISTPSVHPTSAAVTTHQVMHHEILRPQDSVGNVTKVIARPTPAVKKNITEHSIERPPSSVPPKTTGLAQEALFMRPPLKSDLIGPSGKVMLNYIKSIYEQAERVHRDKVLAHKKKLRLKSKHHVADGFGFGSGYLRKRKHRKLKRKHHYYKHYHEEKAILKEMKNIYKEMKELKTKDTKNNIEHRKPSELSTDEARSTIPHPRHKERYTNTISTTPTPVPMKTLTHHTTISPVNVSNGNEGQEKKENDKGTESSQSINQQPFKTIPTHHSPAPKTPKPAPDIETMISQVANKVASDVVNKIQHKDKHPAKKKKKFKHIKKKVHKHLKTGRKSKQLVLEHNNNIKSEFSDLLSKLEAVKASTSSPVLNGASRDLSPVSSKRQSDVDESGLKDKSTNNVQSPVLSSAKKAPQSIPDLSEAVKILESISNPTTSSTKPTQPATDPSIAKAVAILKNINNQRDKQVETTSSKSPLAKAIELLKHVEKPSLSRPTSMSNMGKTAEPIQSPDLNHGNAKSSRLRTRLAKAIEILKDVQDPNLSGGMQGKESEDQPSSEENLYKSSFIPQVTKTPRNPKLEDNIAELHVADLPSNPDLETQGHSLDTNNITKEQEKSTQVPDIPKSSESTEDTTLQHLIDSVADKAAKEVESSMLKKKHAAIKIHNVLPVNKMPRLHEEPSPEKPNTFLMKALDKVMGNKFGRPVKGFSVESSTVASPTSSRADIPVPPDSSAELAPETPSVQELKAMRKFRHQWKSGKDAAMKKVDIPHDTIGNHAYMVVHFSFENINNGVVIDETGLHNNGRASLQPNITTGDTKCGSAMAMNGGQILFNNKAFHSIPREAITVAIWVKFNSIDNLYNLFTTEGNGAKYTFQVTDGKVHWSHLNDNGNVIFALETEPIINLGDWTHIGATYDSRTNLSKVIVNGQVIAQKYGHGVLSQNWDGKAGIGLSGGIRGTVDEFYMFNHALAAADIADLSEECDLGIGESIPMREGGFTGIIPEKEIKEAMARLHGAKLKDSTSTAPTTLPPTTSTTATTPTTLPPTTPTTLPLTTQTTATTPKTLPPTTPTTLPPTTPTTLHLTTLTTERTTATTPKTAQPTSTRKATPTKPVAPTANSLPNPTMTPLAVMMNEPRCQESFFYYNSRLKGGMNAGLFIDLGHVHVTTECLKRCCEIESCDLVLLERDHCYAVDCFNAELCEPVASLTETKDKPSVYYVMRDGTSILEKGVNTTFRSPYYKSPKPTTKPKSIFEEFGDSNSVDEIPTSRAPPLVPGHCTQSMFFYNVKLKSGFNAGTVLVNTFVNSMHECVWFCCKDTKCDIAMMRDTECYTLNCPSGHCTVEDGGDFQISFVSRQNSAFDDISIFPTPSTPTPTLGSDENEARHSSNSQHLSLYLGFERVVGSVVVDGSGFSNDAKLEMGTSIATGRVGSGASLHGGDILIHGNHFKGKPRDAVTIAAWLKLSVTGGLHSIFSTTGSSSIHRKGQYNLEIYNGRVRWYHRDEFARIVFKVQTRSIVTAKAWYHVAATYDSTQSSAKIFVNGNLRSATYGKGRLSQDWGGRASFGSQDGRKILFGNLDEIYMFTRALSDKEIRTYVKNIQSSTKAPHTTVPPTTGIFEAAEAPFLTFTGTPYTSRGTSPTIAPLKQALSELGAPTTPRTTSTKPSTSTTKATTATPTTEATTTTTTKATSTTPTTKASTTSPTTLPPTTTTPPTTTKPPTPATTSTTPTTPATTTTTTKPTSICKLGNVYRNRDLVGGLGAGHFVDKGRVSSIEDCMRMCCDMDNCTVAYEVAGSCFAVECLNKRLCKTFVRTPIGISPVIGFVNRYGNDNEAMSFLTPSALPTNKPSPQPSGRPPTLPLKDIGMSSHTATAKVPTTPTCSHSDVYHHVTLKGGLQAGNFSKLAVLSNIAECARKCCAKHKCDVAIMMGGTCFGLECKTSQLCENQPAHLKHFKLLLVYIQRNGPDAVDHPTTPITKPQTSTKEPSLEELLGRVKPTNSPTTSSFLLNALGKIQTATPHTSHTDDSLCSQGLRVNNVILNGGMGSGEVTQYKNVPDISDCAAKCCHSKGCHVAFVIREVCYTIKCYSHDLCRTRPLEGRNFTSKVVFVSRNGVAMFSSAKEAAVGAFKSDIRSTARPMPIVAFKTNTIPNDQEHQQNSSAHCKAGKSYVNVRLRGDLSAGVFTKRGLVTTMAQCSRFCCDDTKCDVAYLLEGVCYSVRCHSSELCQLVTSSPLAVNPVIAYAMRDNNDGTIQQNANGIMGSGLSPTSATITPVPTHKPTTEPTTKPTQATVHHRKHHHHQDDESKDDEHAHRLHPPHHKHRPHHEHRHGTKHYHHHGDQSDHHRDRNGHHGDHHKAHEKENNKSEKHHKKVASLISHLSSDDLADIASLHVAKSGAELEEITRCTASHYGCQHYCINLNDGGHRCMCHHGYKLATNGRDCEERNECTDGNHGCEHHCTNNQGNYTCECNSGYILNADGKHCDDLDECNLEVSSCSQQCHNTPGSYYCSCGEGYALGSDKFTCKSEETGTKKDEFEQHDRGLEIPTMIVQSPKDIVAVQGEAAIFPCKARGHPAPHIAWAVGQNGDQPLPSEDRFGLLPSGALVVRDLNISDTGIYRCVASNPAGSAARGAFLQVNDRNECSLGKNTCEQVCINTIGSYQCSCNHGYTMNTDGRTCDDVDECQGDHTCNQTCHNTLGSYRCSCHAGYKIQNDRKTCIDIDECSTANDGCTQLCNNTQGSYNCLCLSGYALSADNITCIDHTTLDSQKSTTLTAGMAAFVALVVVSLILIAGAVICALHFIRKRSRVPNDDEEKAYRRSIFSWLE